MLTCRILCSVHHVEGDEVLAGWPPVCPLVASAAFALLYRRQSLQHQPPPSATLQAGTGHICPSARTCRSAGTRSLVPIQKILLLRRLAFIMHPYGVCNQAHKTLPALPALWLHSTQYLNLYPGTGSKGESGQSVSLCTI